MKKDSKVAKPEAQAPEQSNIGRPPVEITPAMVRLLASRDLNKREIAAFLGISRQTLTRRFASPEDGKEFEEAFEQGQAAITARVRNWLFDSAERGNIAARIFLAKNFCGYTDRHAVDHRFPGMEAPADLRQMSDHDLDQEIASIEKRLLLPAGVTIDQKVHEVITKEKRHVQRKHSSRRQRDHGSRAKTKARNS